MYLMSFTGFQSSDFSALTVPGLDPRMAAIITSVRPKLTQIGEQMAPFLSVALGQPVYPHVARHARRSVNPPDDTWVAFSVNNRGYKALPHFQVGLWASHVYIQFAIIYESNNKSIFANNLASHLPQIREQIPGNFRWSLDHSKPYGDFHHSLNQASFCKYIEKLKTVKKSEITCGIDIDSSIIAKMSGPQFIKKTEDTFKHLLPLYKLAF